MPTVIDFNRLKYIKSVTNINGETWAYEEHLFNSYFQLSFRQGDNGIENHVLKLPKDCLMILSQKSLKNAQRYLTHIVELVNEDEEDKPQWEIDQEWGIFRWVKFIRLLILRTIIPFPYMMR